MPLRLLASSRYVHFSSSHRPHIRLILCQTCKTLRDLVDKTPALKYVLALAVRGLCDGPPSTVTAARRLQLLEDYDEAWRTFSWSQYLVLDLRTFEAPYVSGNTLVIRETRDLTRSFIMQSIPSRLRGVPGRQWRIDFDFWVQIFVLDATQDLVVVPNHDPNKLVSLVSLPHENLLTENAVYFCTNCLLVSHTPFPPAGGSFV